MTRLSYILLVTIFLILSCGIEEQDTGSVLTQTSSISGVDISAIPEINLSNPIFYNREGESEAFLSILKTHGINTIRLKLWVDPISEHGGIAEVKTFSEKLKSMGFDIWLTLHYSDTWAHPGQQTLPTRWENLNTETLIDSVYQYTYQVVEEINPTYIQIGNEINTGILFPHGAVDNTQGFKDLLQAGIRGVRDSSEEASIIMHYAGIDGATDFYRDIADLDFDLIGLSYYPLWHGKSLSSVRATMSTLNFESGKEVVIAETAYPFTLEWNDQTHNIVGLQSQLITPDYPASEEGQRLYIRDIRNLSTSVTGGMGFCYWGAELVAWKGTSSLDGSPWENQALFGFENEALPVLEEFDN